MVTKVSGFQSSDGMLYSNELDAYMQELKLVLLQVTGGNVGISNTICANREMVFPAMRDLIEYEATLATKEVDANALQA